MKEENSVPLLPTPDKSNVSAIERLNTDIAKRISDLREREGIQRPLLEEVILNPESFAILTNVPYTLRGIIRDTERKYETYLAELRGILFDMFDENVIKTDKIRWLFKKKIELSIQKGCINKEVLSGLEEKSRQLYNKIMYPEIEEYTRLMKISDGDNKHNITFHKLFDEEKNFRYITQAVIRQLLPVAINIYKGRSEKITYAGDEPVVEICKFEGSSEHIFPYNILDPAATEFLIDKWLVSLAGFNKALNELAEELLPFVKENKLNDFAEDLEFLIERGKEGLGHLYFENRLPLSTYQNLLLANTLIRDTYANPTNEIKGLQMVQLAYLITKNLFFENKEIKTPHRYTLFRSVIEDLSWSLVRTEHVKLFDKSDIPHMNVPYKVINDTSTHLLLEPAYNSVGFGFSLKDFWEYSSNPVQLCTIYDPNGEKHISALPMKFYTVYDPNGKKNIKVF